MMLPSKQRGIGKMRYLVTLAPILGWSQTCCAADITAAPIVSIKGLINQGDDDVFGFTTAGVQNAVVFLESPGGNLGAAIKIGRLAQAKSVDIAVADRATCASACALLWLAGRRRYVGSGARIGFHSAHWIPGRLHDPDASPNASVEKYLRALTSEGLRDAAHSDNAEAAEVARIQLDRTSIGSMLHMSRP
jgi:membrane-bound ClpP family serine protease